MPTIQSEIETARLLLASKLDDLIKLRPLPATAMQIVAACDNEKFSIRDLIKLIECDPAISARILSAVNSSVFGYSQEVTSVAQAVVVLGRTSLSTMAVTIASSKVFSAGEKTAEARASLFQHSLGCATVTRLLVESSNSQVDPGQAFLAGIFHDVGKLLLLDAAPNCYSKIQTDEAGCSIAWEQESFGIDHASLGARFGELWEFRARSIIRSQIITQFRRIPNRSMP